MDPTKLFIINPYGGEGWMMVCPVCGFEYTHTEAAFTRMGTDSAEAGIYRGTEAGRHN